MFHEVNVAIYLMLLFWLALLGAFQFAAIVDYTTVSVSIGMAQSPSLSSGMSPHSPDPTWELWPRLGSSWFPTLISEVTDPGPQIGLARPGHGLPQSYPNSSEAAEKMFGGTWVQSSKDGAPECEVATI